MSWRLPRNQIARELVVRSCERKATRDEEVLRKLPRSERSIAKPGLLGNGGVPYHLIPNEMRVSLKYAQTNNIAAGTYSLQVFRGNSAYDPDYTGVGGQPLGFDEFSALYQNFRVHSSTITWHSGSQASGSTQVMMVVPTLSTSSLTNIGNTVCMPYAKSELLQGDTGAPSVRTIVHAMRTHEIFGVRRSIVENDDTYWGSDSANPGKQFYWHCALAATDGATVLTAEGYIVVEYDMIFFNRKNLALS